MQIVCRKNWGACHFRAPCVRKKSTENSFRGVERMSFMIAKIVSGKCSNDHFQITPYNYDFASTWKALLTRSSSFLTDIINERGIEKKAGRKLREKIEIESQTDRQAEGLGGERDRERKRHRER